MSLRQFFEDWRVKGDESRCFYCGIVMLNGSNIPESHPHFRTKDHFIPRSRKNLWTVLPELMQAVSLKVLACCACNNIKGNRTPEALRNHVRKLNGNDTFFCEALLGITLRSLPEYLAYCKAATEMARHEHLKMTKRSIEAVAARRAAGLLPPVNHKKKRIQAMKENVWWSTMNSIGKLVWSLNQTGEHPELADHLRDTIIRIKTALPEEFARRRMGDTFHANIEIGVTVKASDESEKEIV